MSDYDRRLAQAQDFADGWQQRALSAEAERNRLRVVVERAHDHVGQDERALRSLATDDLVALVGVLRRDYALATNAADAAAEAVGNMAEKCSMLEAERDRLRADHDHLVKINAALRTRPDLAERAPLVVELFADRDRLRAIVRRAQEAWTRHVENYGDEDAFNEWTAAWDALRALDVSGEATDG